MFIERKLKKVLPAPAERNVIAAETLRSAGARVVGLATGPINIRLERQGKLVVSYWVKVPVE